MSRRHARLFDSAPVDPRARDVVAISHQHGRTYAITLACGHSVRRRFSSPPTRLICNQCPSAGGLGGRDFER